MDGDLPAGRSRRAVCGALSERRLARLRLLRRRMRGPVVCPAPSSCAYAAGAAAARPAASATAARSRIERTITPSFRPMQPTLRDMGPRVLNAMERRLVDALARLERSPPSMPRLCWKINGGRGRIVSACGFNRSPAPRPGRASRGRSRAAGWRRSGAVCSGSWARRRRPRRGLPRPRGLISSRRPGRKRPG